MSFWNNPENNSMKTVLVVAVLVVVGFVAANFFQSSSLGGQGKVINVTGSTVNVMPNSAAASPSIPGRLIFAVTNQGADCTIDVIAEKNRSEHIAVAGTAAANGACNPNMDQSTPAAQAMAQALGAGSSSVK